MDDGTGYYGLTFYKVVKDADNNDRYVDVKEWHEGGRIQLDGACGENCMVRIADAIGVHLESIQIAPNEWGYILTDNKA